MEITKLRLVRHYIDYFLPREVMGPVILVFSIENVTDRFFTLFVPEGYGLVAWVLIAILSLLLVKEWGEADEEDMKEFEEEIEEVKKEIEEKNR